MDYSKRLKLSQLTDEEIVEFMEALGDDDDPSEDEVSEDESEAEELPISDGDFDQMENYIQELESDYTNDFPSTEAPSTSLSSHHIIAPSTSALQPTTSNTQKCKPKRPKRNRSPLPELDESADFYLPTAGGFNGTIKDINPQSAEFKSITWKKKHLELNRNEIVFQGEKNLPQCFNELKTPFQCFIYFFTENLFDEIANECVRYAIQQNVSSTFKVTSADIKQYVGILLYMSVYRYPNTESYWSKHAFEPIRTTMTSKRFFEIRKNLHFNDTSLMKNKGEEGYDQLYKIRPLISHFNDRFDSVPKTARLCVDEQMCSTKMMCALRQYMPAKPHKYGIKFFALCDSYGFSYRFEVYKGAGDNDVFEDIPDLGATSNVVVRLSRTIPDFKNYILYFDNFYTSLPLLVYLRSRGILSLGTIRANRIPNCKLSKDKDVSKKERGYSEEFVGTAYGIEIATVIWKDTKAVVLASTYAGVNPFKVSSGDAQPNKTTRYDRKNKQYIEIDCPNIIKEYNYHMGGVDLMDGLLGRYFIRMKTRKWTLRIFYHLIDMAIVNAYLLYRRIHASHQLTNLKLPDFRVEVADVLCNSQKLLKRPVGRPTSASLSPQYIANKKTYGPPSDIRYDGTDQ